MTSRSTERWKPPPPRVPCPTPPLPGFYDPRPPFVSRQPPLTRAQLAKRLQGHASFAERAKNTHGLLIWKPQVFFDDLYRPLPPLGTLRREARKIWRHRSGFWAADADTLPDPPPADGMPRQNFGKSTQKAKLGTYRLDEILGEGEFGQVQLGTQDRTNKQVAVKIIRREKLNTATRMAKVHREILILKQLDHPNIVHLYEMIQTDHTIGIVLEYASGGELFDYILNHRHLAEPEAQRLFAQLISGVGYLHRNGIVHRDLKLENLLLDKDKNIIITDFGFANTFDPKDVDHSKYKQYMQALEDAEKNKTARPDQSTGYKPGDLMATSCGSPCYAAPELVVSDGLYSGRKVDVWSCGVILYAMLAGYLPFDDDPANPEGDNINILYQYICRTRLIFPTAPKLSPAAEDILGQILQHQPWARADLFEVSRHSWLMDYAYLTEAITSSTDLSPEEYRKMTAPSVLKYPIDDFASSSGLTDPITAVKHDSEGYKYSRQVSLAVTPEKKTTPEKHKTADALPKDMRRRTVQVEYVSPKKASKSSSAPVVPASEEGYPERRVSVSQKKASNLSNVEEAWTQERDESRRAARAAEQAVAKAKNDAFWAMASTSQTAVPNPFYTRPVPPVKDSSPSTAVPKHPGPVDARARLRQRVLGNEDARRPLPPARPSTVVTQSKLSTYGQPSAATVTTETAHGRVSGPQTSSATQNIQVAQGQTSGSGQSAATAASGAPAVRSSAPQPFPATAANEAAQGQVPAQKPYNISKPLPKLDGEIPNNTQRMPSGRLVMPPSVEGPGQVPRGHKRASTVGNLSEKLVTRVNSIGRRDSKPPQPKPDRTQPPTRTRPVNNDNATTQTRPGRNYPPTSMRPVDTDNATTQPRKSGESRRSKPSFSNLRHRLSDLVGKHSQDTQEKRSSRRFSFLKSHKNFNDSPHEKSGSSGPARKVMDYFRRRK